MTYETAIIALADPTRRHLFEALAERPNSVGALARQVPVSRPAVSQHLKVLGDAGLVTMTKQGRRNIYAVRREGLAELRAYLDGLWDDVLAAFAAEVEADVQRDTDADAEPEAPVGAGDADGPRLREFRGFYRPAPKR